MRTNKKGSNTQDIFLAIEGIVDKIRRNIIILVVLTFLCLGFMALAHLIETDFGKVDIETGVITTDLGDISYKLYIPKQPLLTIKLQLYFSFMDIRMTMKQVMPMALSWQEGEWLPLQSMNMAMAIPQFQ